MFATWAISILRDVRYLCKVVVYNLLGWIVFTQPLIINPNGTSNPIILIHGSAGNQSEWIECIEWLKKYFPNNPIYAFSMDLPFDDITGKQEFPYRLGMISMKLLAHEKNNDVTAYVKEFHKYANYVINKHENKKLILVGHSMGGLIAHDYALNPENVDRIHASVSISSPILGAPLLENKILKMWFNTNRHKNMTPKSNYLNSLTDRMEKTNTNIKFLTIGSNQDIHVPDTHAKFPEQTNVSHYTFNGYGHFSIVGVEAVWKIIADEIL